MSVSSFILKFFWNHSTGNFAAMIISTEKKGNETSTIYNHFYQFLNFIY